LQTIIDISTNPPANILVEFSRFDSYSSIGFSVAYIGDINQDGFRDFALGIIVSSSLAGIRNDNLVEGEKSLRRLFILLAADDI
jgi:hypothetical protein